MRRSAWELMNMSVMFIMLFPSIMVVRMPILIFPTGIVFALIFIPCVWAIGSYQVALIIIVRGPREGKVKEKPKKSKISYLNAGGLCPPTHLFPPECIPSHAFLFLETRRVVAWSGGGPKLRLPFATPSRQVTVIPLAPPVRCIWRRKLKRSYKNTMKKLFQKDFFITYSISVGMVI